MAIVSELLNSKGNDIWSVGPDESVYDALKIMAEKGVGALMVLEGTSLVGVISERDYARQVILKGRSSESTRVKDIMTTSVVCVGPHQRVDECLSLMTDKRVRHLPVMEEDQLLGVVSVGDLVKSIIEEQRIAIEDLERYITS